MTENEIFFELEKINDGSTTQQIEDVYNQIFSQIARDHSGVYHDDKIEVIKHLVNIYQQTANNPKKSTLISAILNNLNYFEPASQNPKIALKVKALLEKFNDDNYSVRN